MRKPCLASKPKSGWDLFVVISITFTSPWTWGCVCPEGRLSLMHTKARLGTTSVRVEERNSPEGHNAAQDVTKIHTKTVTWALWCSCGAGQGRRVLPEGKPCSEDLAVHLCVGGGDRPTAPDSPPTTSGPAGRLCRYYKIIKGKEILSSSLHTDCCHHHGLRSDTELYRPVSGQKRTHFPSLLNYVRT